MESDWEIEIAPDAPVIDAAWEGFVDLRRNASHARELSEAVQFPALAETLIRLNSFSSPVWTAKCDVWPVDEFDPDEMDADPQSATAAMGCYIDLLPAGAQTWSTLENVVEWCRRLCLELRTRSLRRCRGDAIVRSAFFTPEDAGLGITAYIIACGPSLPEASARLAEALHVVADSIITLGASDAVTSKYNESIVGE